MPTDFAGVLVHGFSSSESRDGPPSASGFAALLEPRCLNGPWRSPPAGRRTLEAQAIVPAGLTPPLSWHPAVAAWATPIELNAPAGRSRRGAGRCVTADFASGGQGHA